MQGERSVHRLGTRAMHVNVLRRSLTGKPIAVELKHGTMSSWSSLRYWVNRRLRLEPTFPRLTRCGTGGDHKIRRASRPLPDMRAQHDFVDDKWPVKQQQLTVRAKQMQQCNSNARDRHLHSLFAWLLTVHQAQARSRAAVGPLLQPNLDPNKGKHLSRSQPIATHEGYTSGDDLNQGGRLLLRPELQTARVSPDRLWSCVVPCAGRVE